MDVDSSSSDAGSPAPLVSLRSFVRSNLDESDIMDLSILKESFMAIFDAGTRDPLLESLVMRNHIVLSFCESIRKVKLHAANHQQICSLLGRFSEFQGYREKLCALAKRP